MKRVRSIEKRIIRDRLICRKLWNAIMANKNMIRTIKKSYTLDAIKEARPSVMLNPLRLFKK